MGKTMGIRSVLVITVTVLTTFCGSAQTTIRSQSLAWTSLNTSFPITTHWSLQGDFQLRRNEFLEYPGFYFLRGGADYHIDPKWSVAAGYCHIWQANRVPGDFLFTNENRLHQQIALKTESARFSVLQRLRNEERWQEKIVNNIKTGEIRFTDRIRYLVSLSSRVFKNRSFPQPVVAGEVMVHFGKEVIHNRIDQRRLFIGFKQTLSSQWSYDMGYMYIVQNRYSAHQRDHFHVLRLFFYYQGAGTVRSDKK